MAAVSFSFLMGSITIIKNKFSASNFWTDCTKHKANVSMYIGEICRYLLSVPPNKIKDKNHTVTKMIGNGLRPQIWSEFTDRFGIELINEFYGSSEGNSNIINIYNKVGSVGFFSVIIPDSVKDIILPLFVIEIDEITGEPIRDSNGFIKKCTPGSNGEFIGKIVKKDPLKDFDGYTDSSATDKKILRDVFKNGG